MIYSDFIDTLILAILIVWATLDRCNVYFRPFRNR
jgi:hypothetical protein